MILLSVSMLIGQEGFTLDEMESQIGCDACFKEKISLENQRENLKVQVESRGVIINESKATIGTMRILLDRYREQYYLSRKEARKEKRRAWFRGLGLGVGIGAGLVVGLVLSSG